MSPCVRFSILHIILLLPRARALTPCMPPSSSYLSPPLKLTTPSVPGVLNHTSTSTDNVYPSGKVQTLKVISCVPVTSTVMTRGSRALRTQQWISHDSRASTLLPCSKYSLNTAVYPLLTHCHIHMDHIIPS